MLIFVQSRKQTNSTSLTDKEKIEKGRNSNGFAPAPLFCSSFSSTTPLGARSHDGRDLPAQGVDAGGPFRERVGSVDSHAAAAQSRVVFTTETQTKLLSLSSTPQEDSKLLELVGQYGPKQWSVISSVRLAGEGRNEEREKKGDEKSDSRPNPRRPLFRPFFFFSRQPQ